MKNSNPSDTNGNIGDAAKNPSKKEGEYERPFQGHGLLFTGAHRFQFGSVDFPLWWSRAE